MNTQLILKKRDEAIGQLTDVREQSPSEIDDNTPDCNCHQHSGWHYCDFHGWCNPSTQIGV